MNCRNIKPYYRGAAKSTFEHAKQLRHNETTAENRLWHAIRNRQVKGFKFRRQHPLYHFVADFYCHEAALVIELDGSIHERGDIKAYDKEREQKIQQLGIRVLRFKNEEVFDNLDGVVKRIEEELASNPQPRPFAPREKGVG